ncbi:hypothetical protein LCGC14_3123590, partial [marine sediment metagenome]
DEVHRVLKPTGHFVIEHKSLYRKKQCVLPEMWLVPLLKEAEMFLRDRLVWWFEIGGDIRKDYFTRRHGVFFWATKTLDTPFYADPIRIPSQWSRSDKRYNNLGAVPHNVFKINRVHNTRDWWRKDSGHPALFPPELIDIMVQSLTQPGDLVVDPFAGIGTVGAVCNWNDRRFIGYEISEDYASYGNEHMLVATRDTMGANWDWLKPDYVYPNGRRNPS